MISRRGQIASANRSIRLSSLPSLTRPLPSRPVPHLLSRVSRLPKRAPKETERPENITAGFACTFLEIAGIDPFASLITNCCRQLFRPDKRESSAVLRFAADSPRPTEALTLESHPRVRFARAISPSPLRGDKLDLIIASGNYGSHVLDRSVQLTLRDEVRFFLGFFLGMVRHCRPDVSEAERERGRKGIGRR